MLEIFGTWGGQLPDHIKFPDFSSGDSNINQVPR